MNSLLKFIVCLLIPLAVFAADSAPLEMAYRSLWPYAEGTQEIKFKEVCRRKSRADTSKVCELVPYKQQNLSKLYLLNQAVRERHPVNDKNFQSSALGRYYSDATRFLSIAETFNRCERDGSDFLKDLNERQLNNVSVEYDCYTSSSDVDAIHGLAQQVDDVLTFNSHKKLVSDISHDALKASIDAHVEFATQFGAGISNEVEANKLVKKICDNDEVSRVSTVRGYRSVTKVQDFCAPEKKRMIKEMILAKTAELKSKELPSTKAFTDSVNESFLEISKILEEHNQEAEALSLVWKNTTPKNRIAQRAHERKVRALQGKKKKAFQQYLVALNGVLTKSGNELLLTETIREKLKVVEESLDKPRFVSISPLTEADVRKARDEALSLTAKQAKELIVKDQEVTKNAMLADDFLKKLIKTNPKSVAGVLSRNPELATKICELNSEIASEMKSEEFWDKAFLVAGVGIAIAGIATGVGAGASVAVIAALSASIALTTVETTYHKDRSKSEALREQEILASLLSGTADSASVQDRNQALAKYEEADFSAKLTLGLGAFDILGIKPAVKMGQMAYAMKGVKNLSGDLDGLNGFLGTVGKNSQGQEALRHIIKNHPEEDAGNLIKLAMNLPKQEQAEFIKALGQMDKTKGTTDLLEKLSHLKPKSNTLQNLEKHLITKMGAQRAAKDAVVKQEDILRHAALSSTERVPKLEKYLKQQHDLAINFNQEQQLAIRQAHESEGEVFKLTQPQIRERVKILRTSGISDDVIRIGMDAGFFGKTERAREMQLKVDRLSAFLSRDVPNRSSLDIDNDAVEGAMKDVRSIILGSDPAEFNTLWSNISKSDLKKMKEEIEKGEIKLDQKAQERFFALYEFMDKDKFGVFWKTQNGNAFGALQTRYPEFRGAGHEGKVGGVTGGMDTYAITEWEGEMMRAAARMDSASRVPMGGSLKQWWNPPVNAVKKIHQFHNQIREQLEHVEETRVTLDGYLDNAGTIGLNSQEVSELRALKARLTDLRKDAKEDLIKAYNGQDITSGVHATDASTNVYGVAKRIDELKLLEVDRHIDSYSMATEEIQDKLHLVLNQARSRNNLPALTREDYAPTSLKISHERHAREARVARGAENSSYGDEIQESFTVNYRWQETVYYTVQETNAQGKTVTVTKSRQETRYSSKTITPSYSDVIDERLDGYSVGRSTSAPEGSGTITSTSGDFDRIIRESKTVAANEAPLRSAVDKAFSDTLSRIEEHSEMLAKRQLDAVDFQKFERSIDSDLAALEAGLKKLDSDYLKKSDSEVVQQWRGDDPHKFRERTTKLRKSYDEARELLLTYKEQVKRNQYELEITPDYPDYTFELNKMKWRVLRNYASKAGLGIGVGTGSTVAVCKYLLQEGKVSSMGSCAAIANEYDDAAEKIKEQFYNITSPSE